MVIAVLIKHGRRKTLGRQENSANYKTTLRLMISTGSIMVLFGLTWVFAAFTVRDASIAFQFLFAIFNSLQGFFIFLFYCVVSKDARMLWISVICRPFGIARFTDTSESDSRAQRARRATRAGTATSGARGTVSTGFSVATRSRASSLPTDSSVSEMPSFVEVNPTAQELGVIQEEPSGGPSSRDAELLAGATGLDTTQEPSPPAEAASAQQPPSYDSFEQLDAPRLSPILAATASEPEAEEPAGGYDLNVSVQRHSTSSHHHETAAISFGGSEDEEDEIHANLAASMSDLPSESN